MLKKKLLVLNTTIALGLSSVFATTGASAETLQEKKQAIENKQADVKAGIHNAEQELKSLQTKQETLEAQITRIANAINDSAEKILEKKNQIKETQEQIKKLEEEIAILKERIQKRNELLKERAVSFQESGGDVSYLEVLLGSSSFSDFVGRMGAVSAIVEADQELLKQHEQDKKELEAKQAAVEKKLSDLQNMLSELEAMRAKLTAQKKQQDAFLHKLEAKEEHTHNRKMSLQEEEENLAAQELAVQKAIALEQKQLAEEAARKRAADQAARQRAAAEAKASANKSTTSNNKSDSSRTASSQGSSEVSNAPAVSSGSFTRPSAGRVTSQMGSRWNKFHAGIDIAQGGTVPVVAAASGVVMRSYTSSTYGNCVMISHSINGQLYTTVYAHLRSKNVSQGQTVSKGQQIGYMGNTGRSFGQHLHFELHKGPWTVSKTNAVNPLDYIPM
ncbi:murein hydrolase activator EnvC [Bacillus sp. V5-8f]|uniref:murein hydrolase activator EnvC family protein n=1 Tax=Bacillus sp. V5-8f TaxID=2053044 RepID=UPI000C7946DE|nr:M23 family metallopeptidase [Bacillus sp. V5-8f]PLT32591.1 peptidase M23 [Bacillus sp. V5-8f]